MLERGGHGKDSNATAEPARKIAAIIERRGLTQAAAAESSDVEIVVKPRQRAAGRARVLVA